MYLPGPAVRRERTSKRKAECDGKSSEGAQRENSDSGTARMELKRETRCGDPHPRVRANKKG